MTIKKGEDWGSAGPLDPDAPVVSTDRQVAELFTIATPESGAPTLDGPQQLGLSMPAAQSDASNPAHHDLGRTVSARATVPELRSGDRPQLPIDLVIVTIDDVDVVMAASLVIRRPLWMGVVEAAMNASFYGEWNVSPSGHPNDGRLDIIRAELSAGDRWKARSRLASGAHLPHPDISVRRLKKHQFDVDGRATVRIDGQDFGHASSVSVVVVPDATTIVI